MQTKEPSVRLRRLARMFAERPTALEWIRSIEFYHVWREECIPCMTLVGRHLDSSLYYHYGGHCQIWTLAGPDYLWIDYWGPSQPDQIPEFIERTSKAIHSAQQFKGGPLYAALFEPQRDELHVLSARRGDGSVAVFNLPLQQHRHVHQLPEDWPTSYRTTIEELAKSRS